MINRQEDNDKNSANDMAKYAGIAFQMLAIIGIFTLVGYKIDAYKQSKTPIFTALLGFLGVIVALYQVIRKLLKK